MKTHQRVVLGAVAAVVAYLLFSGCPAHAMTGQEGPVAIVTTVKSDSSEAWEVSLKKFRTKRDEFLSARREMRIVELNRVWMAMEPLRKLSTEKIQECAEGRATVALGKQTLTLGYNKPLSLILEAKEMRLFFDELIEEPDVVKIIVKPIVRFEEPQPIMTTATPQRIKEMKGVYCGFTAEIEHLDHMLVCGFKSDGTEVHLLLQSPSFLIGPSLTTKEIEDKTNVWRNLFVSAFFKYNASADKAVFQPIILVEPSVAWTARP